MENLQPLDAYTEDIAALWRRQGRIVGVAFGTVMALATPLMVPPDVGAGRVAVSTLLAFVGGGSLFGLGWSWWMASRWTAMTEAVYR